MSETITLVRKAGEAEWSPKTDCYEKLIEQMSAALGGEDEFSSRREFEVIEVQVIRRAKVVREVKHSVNVDVIVAPADAEKAAA